MKRASEVERGRERRRKGEKGERVQFFIKGVYIER